MSCVQTSTTKKHKLDSFKVRQTTFLMWRSCALFVSDSRQKSLAPLFRLYYCISQCLSFSYEVGQLVDILINKLTVAEKFWFKIYNCVFCCRYKFQGDRAVLIWESCWLRIRLSYRDYVLLAVISGDLALSRTCTHQSYERKNVSRYLQTNRNLHFDFTWQK